MEIKHLNAPSLCVMTSDLMKDRFAYKIENLGERGFSDYILTSQEFLEDRIERAKASISELQSIVKSCQGQKLIINEEVAKFMIANGVDKLEGDRLSSLTIAPAKTKKKLTIIDDQALIELGYCTVKVVVDPKAVEANIDKIDESMYKIEETTSQPTIRINKRKGL